VHSIYNFELMKFSIIPSDTVNPVNPLCAGGFFCNCKCITRSHG
jgi:hypothetical protein